MTYFAAKNILDTKDNDRLYEKGEVYPREDLTVSDARIKELIEKGAIVSDSDEPVEVTKPKRSRKKADAETEGE